MAEALATVNTTAKKYFAGAQDSTLRRRLLLKLLEKNGRIKFNENGTTCTWNVEFAQQAVQPHGAVGEYTFSQHDGYRQLEIDVRGYVATDMMTTKDQLMNKGNVAIINRYAEIFPQLLKSLNNNFHAELYIDGNLAGNTNRLHGVKSFLGYTACTTADLVAQPNDTYGGQSTALAAQAGTWSSDLASADYPNATLANDWPDGNGTSEYDYISPVIVNINSTRWGATSNWADNCGKILRRTTTWLTKNGGQEGKPTCYMMGNQRFNGYQDYQEVKFRNIIPHPEARDLGFPDALNQDGVMVKYEFDVPAVEVFGLNIYQMELASWDSVLFGTRGPFYDIRSDAYLFKAGFFGNMRYFPKAFGRIRDATS